MILYDDWLICCYMMIVFHRPTDRDYQFDGIYRYLTLDRPDRLSELKLRTLYDHEEHRLDSSLSFLLRYTYGPEVLRKSVHKFVHLINSHRAGKLKLSRQEVAAMMSAVQSIVEVELKISNRDASMFEDQLTAITADKDGRTHALKAYLDVDPKRIGKAMQSTSMDQQINAEVNDYINKQLPMNIALSAYTVNDTKAMVAMKKERIVSHSERQRMILKVIMMTSGVPERLSVRSFCRHFFYLFFAGSCCSSSRQLYEKCLRWRGHGRIG